jgi:phage tail-like protein
MAKYSINSHRTDPYKNFKFRIKWDNKVVAAVSKISALKRTTEVIKWREGNDPSTQRHMPGQSAFEAITVERGVTHDDEFQKWANLVYDVGSAGEISLKNFRKPLTIEFLNENGKVAKVYKVYNCWVSEYQALPELDGNANAVAIEMMKIENEGWELDPAQGEPTET